MGFVVEGMLPIVAHGTTLALLILKLELLPSLPALVVLLPEILHIAASATLLHWQLQQPLPPHVRQPEIKQQHQATLAMKQIWVIFCGVNLFCTVIWLLFGTSAAVIFTSFYLSIACCCCCCCCKMCTPQDWGEDTTADNEEAV